MTPDRVLLYNTFMSLNLAGCVILDKNQNMYLLHRNKKGVVQWELPGGKVDPGESDEQTAIREIREELGVTVNLVRSLGMTQFEENDTNHIYTWYLAEIQEGTPSIREPHTFDDLKSFSVDELSSLKLSNNMMKLYEAILAGKVQL